MTGSLQIKKGMYYTHIYLGQEHPNPHKWQSTGLSVSGNNKRAAEKILRERIAHYELMDPLSDSNQLFTDFLKEWLLVARHTIKENTYYQYKLIVNSVIIPYFEPLKIKLVDLKPQHLQSYYNMKLDEGLTGSTIRRYHANIRKALSYAVSLNNIPYNPADRVVLPKENPPRNSFYTTEEIKRLLKLIKGTQIETPVMIATIYGFRLSEVIGLKWDAVDFGHHTISVQHTVTGAGSRQVREDSTKTARSRRTIHLLTEIEDYLKTVMDRQDEMRSIFGSSYVESDYICTWDDGRLLSPEYVSRNFKNLVQESDLPVYRFHDLRHSSASLLAKYGYSLKEIGEWLGHASVASTNRYAHLQHQATIKMANTVSKDVFSHIA